MYSCVTKPKNSYFQYIDKPKIVKTIHINACTYVCMCLCSHIFLAWVIVDFYTCLDKLSF